MDLVGTAIHELSAALAHVDHAAFTPIIVIAAIVTLGGWILLRRRKGDRARG
jgi:LPXTG-motif cell wall-anchored protein